jgi:serine O-acetyltransferase
MSSVQKDVNEESDAPLAERSVQTSAECDLDAIEISPSVTLSGIFADLLMHAPLRENRSWTVYVLRVVLTALTSSGFHMAFAYRWGAFFHRLRLRPLCFLIEKFIYHWYHCVFPCSARIGPGIWIPHPLGIVLNSRSRLGADVWLRQFAEIVHVWAEDEGKSGIVGDRVQLNSGSILLRGAVIGHDSIVAARAVVTRFIPPGHIARGIPARATPMSPEQFLDRSPRWKQQ